MLTNQYILVVEDDHDISEAIESIISDENIKIKCVFNGNEALDFLNTTNELPSLILLDLMMPKMNGYQFREAQLADPRFAYIPVIIFTASGHYENLDKLQFQDLLKKPLDLEILVTTVKKYLNPTLE